MQPGSFKQIITVVNNRDKPESNSGSVAAIVFLEINHFFPFTTLSCKL